MQSSPSHLNDANLAALGALNTVGRFVDELEVHLDDPMLPNVASLPALTTTHSTTSNSSTNSLHASRSDMISSSELESAMNAQLVSNPFLSPAFDAQPKDSVSFNGREDPSSLLATHGNKQDDENVISISLADFDDLDLGLESGSWNAENSKSAGPSGIHLGSDNKEGDSIRSKSHSFSGIILNPKGSLDIVKPSPSVVECTTHPSLAADASLPISSDQHRQLTRHITASKSFAQLSSSLPVTSSEGQSHHILKRKKFVLKPQHINSYSPPMGENLTYTTELPELFKNNLKSSLADSYSSKIRRKVSDSPPPLLPALLETSFFNASAKELKEDQSALPIPSHAILNHLATASIKHDMLAVASTTRYREIYSKSHCLFSRVFFTNTSSYSNFVWTHLIALFIYFNFIRILRDVDLYVWQMCPIYCKANWP